MEVKLTNLERLVSRFVSEEFIEDESGQGITEYGAVLAFVALIIAMVFMAGQGMNSSISSLFNAPVNQLERVVAYDASGAGSGSGSGSSADSGGSSSGGSSAAADSGGSSSSGGSAAADSSASGGSNSNAGGNGNGNSNSNAGGNGNGRGNGRGGNTRFTR